MVDRDEWFAVHASGPAAQALGAVGSAAVAPTGGGGFRVEPEAAPLVRAGFEDAIQEMQLARRAVQDMAYLGDESVNPVVDKYLAALGEMAYGEEGSVTMAADSAMAAYQDVIDQLDRAMAAYQDTDDPNRFRQS